MKEIIIALLIGAFLTRIVLYMSYGRILKIAYNASNTNHELLKQIKLRYTNCNTLDIPIINIGAFVKKHILLNCGFKRMVPIIDMIGYGCLLLAVFFTYIYYGMTKFDKYGVYICTYIMVFLLLNSIIKGEEKLNIATTLISDYIENVLSHRNINKREKMNKRKEEEHPRNDVINETESNVKVKEESLGALISTATDNVQAEMIINEVLKEYLI